MTPTSFRRVARVRPGALVLVGAALAAALRVPAAPAQQATTTGTVRGVVTGANAGPLNGATVIAINAETGVRRGALADEAGRYQLPFLDPGSYTVRAQFIGYRPVERTDVRISIGQVEKVDFRLEQTAVQLGDVAITAVAEAPLIETQKTSSSTRVSESQIRDLPTNGRNFKDLVVLAPGTSSDVGSGSGGSQSVGGGRAGATNVLIDGVNNNESFFGGDARGGDRAPFSYSIEAVKEIQVISAAYDVERGNFTGGTVNAVTKSGTNHFHGTLFGYLRQDSLGGVALTGRDFTGRPANNFKAQQFGFSLGGPIVKDQAHFFFSVDRQVRDEPRNVLVSSAEGDAFTNATGVNPDTLRNFFRILRDVYGYEAGGEIGNIVNATNETAFFGRVDWQLSEKHHLTLRDNYTDVEAKNDRITVSPTTTEFASNGGPNKDKANSLVGSLTSIFGGGLTNEFRAQYAREEKPRPSNPSGQFGVALPQVSVNGVRSVLSNGTNVTTTLRFGADPVLHNNYLDQKTLELIDNVRLARGSHTVKLGTNFLRVGVINRFWQNSLGSFAFSNTSDFEAGVVNSYSRNLPFSGKSQIEVQDFTANEASLYLQDEWQVHPRLFLTAGVRYDYNWFDNKPDPNPTLSSIFPQYNTAFQPRDKNNVSPRVGFTFDPAADGRQVIRGGTGIFYGRLPYVVYSNALAQTGRTQLTLNCGSGASPGLDFPAWAQDPSAIPSSCVGPSGTPPVPDINVFDRDFEQSYSWKANLAYDRLIIDGWRLTLEGVYGATRDNFVLDDINLNPVPRFFAEGSIPVFVDPSTINATNGAVNRVNSRRTNQFDRVWVTRSVGSANSWQGIVQVDGRTSWGGVYATYTYDDTKDNFSRSCCTLGGDFWPDTRAYGNPANYDNQWGPAAFNRRHNFVLSPRVNLPYGIQLSGIVRLFSGRPYTPVYQFDINGDGQSNDRVYVPTTADLQGTAYLVGAANDPAAEVTRQKEAMERIIRANDCLNNERGRVVDRNGCRNPWQKVVDARLAKRFSTVRGQSVELQADFFNLLNAMSRKWGRREEVSFSNAQFLVPVGFDATQRKFRYRVNEQFGQVSTANLFTSQQFQMQLGLRYNF